MGKIVLRISSMSQSQLVGDAALHFTSHRHQAQESYQLYVIRYTLLAE
jgi:hypothetical protein